MATIDFPSSLPTPLRSGYGLQHVSPMMRSELQSGRARQRRRYTSVPSMASVSWLLSDNQAMAFESWFRDAITDGADWFNCRLSTPIGLRDYECRFADMYDGPELVGPGLWRITASLELRERPLIAIGWSVVPEIVTYANVFDVAVNREWPL